MFKKWQREWQLSIITFLFFLIVLTFFRVAFLLIFSSKWIGEGLDDFFVALWFGTRLSLKSAGHPVLFTFLLCSVPVIFIKKWTWVEHWRNSIIGIWLFIFTFLGFARYPYYSNFDSGFNGMLFQGINEDFTTLVWTVHAQFPIYWMLLGVLAVWLLFFCLWLKLKKLSLWTYIDFKERWKRIVCSIVMLIMLVMLGIFAGNGGSFFEAWAFRLKNSAVAKNDFLNEVIVDEVQGLYRAWDENKRLTMASRKDISREKMQEYGRILSEGRNKEPQKRLSDFLIRESQGSKIEPPAHVFIIIAESYAQWPLQDQNEKFHLAEGIKSVMKENDHAWLSPILTNGDVTISAVSAILTGLAEVGQVPTYQAETYKNPYETALAPQIARLGYQSYFWYGGPSGWYGLKKFVLSQGFSEFYGAGELELLENRNRWGSSDQVIFDQVLSRIDQMPSPAVHVILTISNHSPYTIDLVNEGFDIEAAQSVLPENLKNDKELLTAMGHQWYADREMARFIKEMQKKEPNSMFIVMGDHGSRNMYLDPSPSLFQKNAVPLIFIGPKMSSELFPKNAAGSQIQVIPTLIELIAPKGFNYYSIGPSITRDESVRGVNSGFWITSNEIGSRWTENQEIFSAVGPTINRDVPWEEAVLAYSWWRVAKGNKL